VRQHGLLAHHPGAFHFWALTRFIAAQLYRTEPTDPATTGPTP
jgi:hypothetical protein